MIQFITGALGAGKTLFAVSLLFEALCEGRSVVTNIEVNFDELSRLAELEAGVILDPRQLCIVDPEKDRLWQDKIPWGVMGCCVEVFFDEIHLMYNARDWQKADVLIRSLVEFLTQSRKAHVNITFIAQDAETVDRQFRAFAEWELAIVSSKHIPGFGDALNALWPCFVVKYKSLKNGEVLKKRFRRYDPRLFRCYASHSFLTADMRALSERVERRERFKLRRTTLRRRMLLSLLQPFRTVPVLRAFVRFTVTAVRYVQSSVPVRPGRRRDLVQDPQPE